MLHTIKSCQQVIRFRHTLVILIKFKFQFSLIAAYLKPTDADAWVRLAEMSLEKNDVNQGIKCYTHGNLVKSELQKESLNSDGQQSTSINKTNNYLF